MIYAFVQMKISNKDSLGQYREVAADALAKHGGAVLSAGADCSVIEGEMMQPDIAAVLSFPDRDAAMAWIDDPELISVHALRRGAGEVSIVVIG